MRRALLALTLLLLAALLAWGGWALWAGAFSYRPLRITGDAADPGTDPGADARPTAGVAWEGAVHVHTSMSGDARGSIEQIAAAAGRAGLDFVVVADHTRALGTAGRVEGGWYGDVLVVVGEEISTDAGHLLALGVRPHPYALGPEPTAAISDIEQLDGRALIAHPGGGESAWRDGWSRAAGVEVASLSTALARSRGAELLGGALLYPINPEAAMARLARAAWPGLPDWAERTRMNGPLALPLAALGAVDAHGPVLAGFPTHEAAFRALSTVVWMDAAPTPGSNDRAESARLTRRLLEGRSAVVWRALGSAPGLNVHAEQRNGKPAFPGEVARWRPEAWTIRADLGGPGPYRIELSRDGEPIARSDGGPLEAWAVTPGTYRVQVTRTDVDDEDPWIVVNPIYLWTDEAIAASRIQPAPPLPAPAEIESLLPQPGWAAEADARSRSALGEGEPGLRWELGLVDQEAEDAYAALAWRPDRSRDWRHTDGLVVRLRSDREWRVSVRVWTLGEDGVERTWERTAPSSPESPERALPWSGFRLIGQRGVDAVGIPEQALAAVTGAALVVTPQRMRPGTEASIDVERMALFGTASGEAR